MQSHTVGVLPVAMLIIGERSCRGSLHFFFEVDKRNGLFLYREPLKIKVFYFLFRLKSRRRLEEITGRTALPGFIGESKQIFRIGISSTDAGLLCVRVAPLHASPDRLSVPRGISQIIIIFSAPLGNQRSVCVHRKTPVNIGWLYGGTANPTLTPTLTLTEWEPSGKGGAECPLCGHSAQEAARVSVIMTRHFLKGVHSLHGTPGCAL